MALIGNGAQGEFQALAFRDLVGVQALSLYDSDRAATAKLVANLAGQGLRLQVCESTAEAVRGADIVTTATADKTRAAILPPDFAVTEFWQVLAGQRPGRRQPSEVTVFDSVGFALEDFAALAFMGEAAAEHGFGEVIELMPKAADPKDLFGLLAPNPRAAI